MQWQPESLLVGRNSVSRPRVYLIDFETAVKFSGDIPPPDRLCVGLPQGGGIASHSRYIAPQIPEMATGEPYDPFKLDVWQLASCFKSFDVRLMHVRIASSDDHTLVWYSGCPASVRQYVCHGPTQPSHGGSSFICLAIHHRSCATGKAHPRTGSMQQRGYVILSFELPP